MSTLHPTLLITLLFLYPLITSNPCIQCTQKNMIWCSQNEHCVSKESECSDFPITWWRMNSNTSLQLCESGIITRDYKCPKYELMIHQDVSKESYSMIYPLDIQPILNFSSADRDIIAIGGYFHEQPKNSKNAPRFFSVNYNVKKQWVAKFENGKFIFDDLTIIAQPGDYKIGFAVAFLEDEKVKCAFVPSKVKIDHHAVYESLYEGPHIYIGVTIWILGFAMVLSPIFCCYKYMKEDEEPVEDSLGRERSLKDPILTRIMRMIGLYFTAGNSTLVRNCGTDVYFYQEFQFKLIIYTITCGLIGMAVLLPIFINSNDFDLYADFGSTTIAAVDHRMNKTHTIAIMLSCVFPIVGFIFLWRLGVLSRIIVKGNHNYGSMFTVMVKNISPSVVTDSEFAKYFEDTYGQDNVIEANLALNWNKVMMLTEKKEQLMKKLDYYERIYEETNERPYCRVGLCSKIDAINYYSNWISKLNEIIRVHKRLESLSSSGTGFITFSKIRIAQKCIQDHEPKYCLGIPFRWPWSYQIQKAPEAEDILWKNLGVGTISRLLRKWTYGLLTTFALILIYTATFIYSLFEWSSGQHASSFSDWFSPLSLASALLIELLPEIVSLLNEIIKLVLEVATEKEYHETRNEFTKSLLQKVVFVLFMNVLVLPRIYVYYNAVWRIAYATPPYDNYFYFFNANGVSILKFLIAQVSIAKGLELMLSFAIRMIKWFRTGTLTRARFEYTSQYGMKITIMLLWVIYGTLMPLIFPFVIAYYVISFMVDRFLIMFVYARTEDSDGEIIKQVISNVSWYLTIYPFVMLAIYPAAMTSVWTWFVYLPLVFVLGFMLHYVQKSLRKKSDKIIIDSIATDAKDGIERQLTIDEIENMNLDLHKLARKYRHPLKRQETQNEEVITL